MQDGNGQRKTSSRNRAAAAVTQNVHQTRQVEQNALMHRDNVRQRTCSRQHAADDIAADEPKPSDGAADDIAAAADDSAHDKRAVAKRTLISSVNMTAATCARKAGRHRGHTSSSCLAAAGACAVPHHTDPHAPARACARACVRARAHAWRRACARAWLRTACGRQHCRRQRAADVVGDMQQTPCQRGKDSVQQT